MDRKLTKEEFETEKSGQFGWYWGQWKTYQEYSDYYDTSVAKK